MYTTKLMVSERNFCLAISEQLRGKEAAIRPLESLLLRHNGTAAATRGRGDDDVIAIALDLRRKVLEQEHQRVVNDESLISKMGKERIPDNPEPRLKFRDSQEGENSEEDLAVKRELRSKTKKQRNPPSSSSDSN